MGYVTLSDQLQKSAEKTSMINIEVAYALPDRQKIVSLEIPGDCNPRDAIKLSGINKEFPEINLETAKIGVFGKAIPETYQLQERDRIEIYRPLLADPKEVRRRLAAQGKTMGNKN